MMCLHRKIHDKYFTKKVINNPQVTGKKEEYKRNAGCKVENPHKTEAYIQEPTGIVPRQDRVKK